MSVLLKAYARRAARLQAALDEPKVFKANILRCLRRLGIQTSAKQRAAHGGPHRSHTAVGCLVNAIPASPAHQCRKKNARLHKAAAKNRAERPAGPGLSRVPRRAPPLLL